MPELLADEDIQRIHQSGVHAIGFICCADDGLWPDDVPAPALALLLCNEEILLREVEVVDTGFSTGFFFTSWSRYRVQEDIVVLPSGLDSAVFQILGFFQESTWEVLEQRPVGGVRLGKVV